MLAGNRANELVLYAVNEVYKENMRYHASSYGPVNMTSVGLLA